MATDGSDGGGGRPPPRNLQGLLKFCVEHTKSEDAPGASGNFQPELMSEERRQWLAEAVESLQGSDPVKVMLIHIQVILDHERDTEEKEASLDELQDYCEDLDLAMDFHKIGGYEFLLSMLRHPEAGIRWRAANLIGTVVQNNPYCQERALEMGLVQVLLKTVDSDQDVQVRVKSLFAVSSLCRDFIPGQKIFTENDGFSVLLRTMQSGNEKLQTKSSFMLRAMCQSEPKFKDTLCDIGMVEQFVALLQQEHTPTHEHLLAALLAMAENHSRTITECRRPELGLQELLQQRQALLENKPESEEEVAYAKALVQLITTRGTSTVDR